MENSDAIKKEENPAHFIVSVQSTAKEKDTITKSTIISSYEVTSRYIRKYDFNSGSSTVKF